MVEKLEVRTGETISLDGPVEVEFWNDDHGTISGVASQAAGGVLYLTGVEGITFVKREAIVAEQDRRQDARQERRHEGRVS